MATRPVVDWSEDERSWCALMVRVAEGDESALTQLYDGTNRLVYGLALRILGDSSSAEDVTLEVYLQVWRTAAIYDPARGRVSSWLVTLTRSRAIDSLRSHRGRTAILEQSLEEISDPQDLHSGPERLSIEAAQTSMIHKFLAELPIDQRHAIELAYFSGLSHSEIAARTGLPPGTVKTRIRLGMVRLRQLLAPYGGGTMSSQKPGARSDVHELVSLYALNALDGSEKAAFEEHLRRGCGKCEADLRLFTRVADAIGTSVPASPPPQLRERLRSQLSRSSRMPGVLLQQSGLLISRSDELAWRAMTPGITYKPLYEDSVRKHHTSLVRMDAGAHYPSHRHSEIEELFVLSGDLHVEGQIMRSGDYCRAESGTIHGETLYRQWLPVLAVSFTTERGFLLEQDSWFALEPVLADFVHKRALDLQ